MSKRRKQRFHQEPSPEPPLQRGPVAGFFFGLSGALTSARGSRLLGASCLLVLFALIGWICAFKIMDRDFWWHIKAGEVMVRELRFITVEPFAYTRIGQPYLSNHEWLAQIVLYLVHAAGGSTGIILFRTAMIALAALLLILIDRKRIWPNVFLLVYSLDVARTGFMERHQLFTFVLLPAFLLLAFRILDDETAATASGWRGAEKLLWWFVPLELLWVNTHGAAALLGLGIVGALLVQRAAAWLWELPGAQRRALTHGIGRLAGVCAVMALCLLISPSGWHNLSFLNSLLHDRTTEFIGEWQPRALGAYLADYALLWIAGLAAILASRRKWVFSALVFLATGYLSLQAIRHEMLFAFAAAGIVIYQLRHQEIYCRAVDWLKGRLILFFLCTATVLAAIACFTWVKERAFAVRDQLYGYGVFAPAKGAYDFLEREHVAGKFFNTYGIGGYLLYRGYPDRQVYIDGRNVDYGHDFMSRTYAAQSDPAAWKKLEDQYGFTAALIDYDAISEPGNYPFSDHLDRDPDWKLVYLDDWTGVYLKDTPENRPVIDRDALKSIAPRDLSESAKVDMTNEEDLPMIERELLRIAAAEPAGIKARLRLADLYRRERKYDRAEQVLRDALAVQPRRPETHLGLADTYAAAERWAEAAAEYERAIADADQANANVYDRAAKAFDKAGDQRRAAALRAHAAEVPSGMPQLPPTGDSASQAKIEELLRQLQSGSDAGQSLVDHGVAAAEAGRLDEAIDLFQKALAADPRDAAALNNLGAAYQQGGDYARAESYFRQALEINKDYADAEYNLALALYSRKNYAEAMIHAQRAKTLGHAADDVISAIKAVR